MTHSISILVKLQLMNTFRINEIRYTKDHKLRGRLVGMLGVYGLLIAMLMAYIVMTVYGLADMQLSEIIPTYLFFIASMLTLFFAFFKSTDYLFNLKAIEWQMPFPIKGRSFIMSRLILFYVSSLLPSLLVLLPGLIAYSVLVSFDIGVLLWSLIGSIVLPIFPIVLMSILGALVAGVASRMKHKQLIISLIMLVLVLGILMISLFFSNQSQGLDTSELSQISRSIENQIAGLYPPAIWFSQALRGENVMPFLGYLLVLFIMMALFVALLDRYYFRMISRLSSHGKTHQKKRSALKEKSVLKALVMKEWYHYWSSSIYVLNTLMGPLFMLVLALAIVFMGPDYVDQMLGIQGVSLKAMPFLLGATAAIMPVTVSSISLEGKNIWQLQTLPISRKKIIHSKLLLQLIITLPFYFISEIIILSVSRLTSFNAAMLLIIPLLMVTLSSEMGLIMNLLFPVYNWESETVVVKQSASVFLSLIVNVVLVLVPLFISLAVEQAWRQPVMIGIVLIWLGLILLAYRISCSQRLLSRSGLIG